MTTASHTTGAVRVPALTLITPPFTRDELIKQFTRDRFVHGRPAHVHPDTIAIDRQVAAESRCDECGAAGLIFESFRPADRRQSGYRGIVACPVCDSAMEA